jgi:hypothetical protein
VNETDPRNVYNADGAVLQAPRRPEHTVLLWRSGMSADLSSILHDPALLNSARRRLTAHAIEDAVTGCHVWQKGINSKGYATMRVLRRPHSSSLASRVAYIIAHGPIPPDTMVCHHCDNPRCVNVLHLFLGTQQDNMDDMKAKGRQRSLTGERSHFAKITAADVVRIRERYAVGESPTAIGNDYGLTFNAVWLIATGRKWKHVPGACPSRGYAKKTKMTPQQIAEARELNDAGVTFKKLGERYGLTKSAVHRLVSNLKKTEAVT